MRMDTSHLRAFGKPDSADGDDHCDAKGKPVVLPDQVDCFLCSHEATDSTRKAAHYHVLRANDNCADRSKVQVLQMRDVVEDIKDTALALALRAVEE